MLSFVSHNVTATVSNIRLERYNEELMGFARHKNINARTLDMLALGYSKEIRDAVSENKNTSEETHKKIAYMKHNW